MTPAPSHVLREWKYERMAGGHEEEPVGYTLTAGEVIVCDAGFHNPFKEMRRRG